MNQAKLKQLFTEPLPQKVKLELKQPAIMCSGRDIVSARYRGVAKRLTRYGLLGRDQAVIIEFKYKGETIEELMSESGRFLEPLLQDIVLV
jgi:hypothetical protein